MRNLDLAWNSNICVRDFYQKAHVYNLRIFSFLPISDFQVSLSSTHHRRSYSLSVFSSLLPPLYSSLKVLLFFPTILYVHGDPFSWSPHILFVLYWVSDSFHDLCVFVARSSICWVLFFFFLMWLSYNLNTLLFFFCPVPLILQWVHWMSRVCSGWWWSAWFAIDIFMASLFLITEGKNPVFSEVTQEKKRSIWWDGWVALTEGCGIWLTLRFVFGCFNNFFFHYCDCCGFGLLPTDSCSFK